jgi:hypothetical protein
MKLKECSCEIENKIDFFVPLGSSGIIDYLLIFEFLFIILFRIRIRIS